MAKKVFREYASDDSFTKLNIPKDVSEYQVCLAFARDYHGKNSTDGKFTPYWDTERVTPDVITQFKRRCAANKIKVKVVLSIGNYTKQFPFKTSGDTDKWKQNAIKSIQGIINDYHLDGIDIHYMDVSPVSKDSFVDCIGELVQNIKGTGGAKLVVSLATNAVTNDLYYAPLYQSIQDTVSVETVVFQCFINFKVDPKRPLQSLVDEINTVAVPYVSVTNFLPGYSAISDDWTTVSPPLFFLTLFSLLQGGETQVNGSSIKVAADINAFLPKWIPEMLSFSANNDGA